MGAMGAMGRVDGWMGSEFTRRPRAWHRPGKGRNHWQSATGNLQSLIGAAVRLSIADYQLPITDDGADRVVCAAWGKDGNRQLATGNLQSLIGAAVRLSTADYQLPITDGSVIRGVCAAREKDGDRQLAIGNWQSPICGMRDPATRTD
jgi:hypothetical protein